jgi:hypothetical protein
MHHEVYMGLKNISKGINMPDKNNSLNKPNSVTHEGMASRAPEKVIPMCTGNLLFQMKNGCKLEVGEEKLKESISKLSPEYQEIFSGLIFSDRWYPERAVAEMLRAASEVIGEEAVRKIARAAAKREMSTAFKLLLRLFVSPQKFAENNEKLWTTLHNTGKLKVTINLPKTNTVEITDFDFITDIYMLCYMDYREGVLELIGVKNPKCTYLKTKDKYIFKATWD